MAQQTSVQFPSRDSPLVDKNGKVTEQWYLFFSLEINDGGLLHRGYCNQSA